MRVLLTEPMNQLLTRDLTMMVIIPQPIPQMCLILQTAHARASTSVSSPSVPVNIYYLTMEVNFLLSLKDYNSS